MILQVNLIPALAYALVTMFSNMAGLTPEISKSTGKQQIVSSMLTHQAIKNHRSSLLVTKNGQIILSSGTGMGNMEWRIPYTPENQLVRD